MAKITKIFTSETAHIVRNATSSRCKFNVHGHSYKWEITIEGFVSDKTGMVLDFIELKPIKEFIDKFDHSMVLWDKDEKDFKEFFLQNCHRIVIMNKNCTAENMASLVHQFIYVWLKKYKKFENFKCIEVKVYETATSCGIAIDSSEYDFCHFIIKEEE